MSKPVLYDVYCGGGGATKGYQQAGFYVVGVDNEPQPHYCGDEFILTDALLFLQAVIDDKYPRPNAIHASPPCQRYSDMTKGRWKDRINKHPDLIASTREVIQLIGVPYVIENVEGARSKLINPILLCGTMFGLQTSNGNQLLRHRYFEVPWKYILTPPCNHNKSSAIGVYGGGQNPARRKRRYKAEGESADFGIKARREAMGIDWMTGSELNQAIPPVFTKFIGRLLYLVVSYNCMVK